MRVVKPAQHDGQAQGGPAPARPYLSPVALGALLLLLAAAILHFAVAPRTSVGFTYLAVVVALWGLGGGLAAGLRD